MIVFIPTSTDDNYQLNVFTVYDYLNSLYFKSMLDKSKDTYKLQTVSALGFTRFEQRDVKIESHYLVA